MLSRDDGKERDPLVREVKFPLGQLFVTPGVHQGVPPSEVFRDLRRHSKGDWGDLCTDDRATNEQSLIDGLRLVSVYVTKAGTKFYVITEADRSSTTVLLPEEY